MPSVYISFDETGVLGGGGGLNFVIILSRDLGHVAPQFLPVLVCSQKNKRVKDIDTRGWGINCGALFYPLQFINANLSHICPTFVIYCDILLLIFNLIKI